MLCMIDIQDKFRMLYTWQEMRPLWWGRYDYYNSLQSLYQYVRHTNDQDYD